MKKLFFSAVALVAFSSVSMAKSNAFVEDTVIFKSEIFYDQDENTETLCSLIAIKTLDELPFVEYLSEVAYANLYRGLVDNCNNSFKLILP